MSKAKVVTIGKSSDSPISQNVPFWSPDFDWDIATQEELDMAANAESMTPQGLSFNDPDFDWDRATMEELQMSIAPVSAGLGEPDEPTQP